MTFLVGLMHTGDSIAGTNDNASGVGPSYFFQAYSWTGLGDQGTALGQSFFTYYATNLIARNQAVSGSKLTGSSNDVVNIAPTYLDPVIPVAYAVPPFDKARRYIFTTAIGSNDGATGDPGTFTGYAAAVATMCVARKTAGYNLVGICTLLPRSTGMLESDRLGYNALVMDSSWRASHGIDFAIDLASQPLVGDPANCSNATYYSQTILVGVHPTEFSHSLLAPIYLAGINAAIAML